MAVLLALFGDVMTGSTAARNVAVVVVVAVALAFETIHFFQARGIEAGGGCESQAAACAS